MSRCPVRPWASPTHQLDDLHRERRQGVVKVQLQPTPEPIHAFNRSHAKKIGLFHVTC
jgi:hypothetical protein